MARHIVCLTFDYDAVSGWIARGFTTPTPVSRGEFGVVGASRVLALLREFDQFVGLRYRGGEGLFHENVDIGGK